MTNGPVTSAFQAGLAGGIQGGIAGGIPGAILGVATGIISSIAAGRQGRIQDFPPGHPKHALAIPFNNVMAQFRDIIGQEIINQKFGRLSAQELASIPQSAKSFRAAGTQAIVQIFNEATLEQINAVIGIPSEVVIARRQELEAGQLSSQANGGTEMVQNVVTGQEQGPSMIDRGRVNEGLGNELVTQPQARAIAPLVVPTIDLARYIPHERIFGNGVQRSNMALGPGPIADATYITIEGRSNQQIFIRSVQVDVSPRLTGGTPQWIMRARSVVPGDTNAVLSHFFVERNDSLLTRGDTIFSRTMPSFTVPEGFDYIIRFELFGTRHVRLSLNVDGIYIPVGVNGSKC